uniref:Protein unc-50 homolog n=1 Tax=Ciona savignyi TaxID=51511 RepID=H2ZG25_CIOSA
MTSSYASPPGSVYSYATSTKSGRSISSRNSEFSYTVGENHGRNKLCNTAGEKSYKYLRRLIRFRQMDFEFALWQMMHLFVSPQKVYRNFQYRKQTKNQFARDDPAFLVLLSLCFCVTSVGFGLVMRLSVKEIFKLLLWVVFVDCIFVGIIIATIMWLLTNRFMVHMSRLGQDIEWAYAFDVHLNAFFPVLMILHCLQLFLINPLIDKEYFISTVVGNTFWLVALGYYIYITFLGYSVLPFVKKTVAILSALIVLFIAYFITLACRWNITRGLLWFYKHRV